MLVDPTVPLSTLRADYRAAVEASNAIMTGIGDMNAAVAYEGRAHNLRSAVLSVLGETARHAATPTSSGSRSTDAPAAS